MIIILRALSTIAAIAHFAGPCFGQHASDCASDHPKNDLARKKDLLSKQINPTHLDQHHGLIDREASLVKLLSSIAALPACPAQCCWSAARRPCPLMLVSFSLSPPKPQAINSLSPCRSLKCKFLNSSTENTPLGVALWTISLTSFPKHSDYSQRLHCCSQAARQSSKKSSLSATLRGMAPCAQA